MVSKVTHLKKTFTIMAITFILLTLIFSPLAKSIPINLHYVHSLSNQISEEIYIIEVHKPILDLIGEESYETLVKEVNMNHSVKNLDRDGELRLIKDKTLNQQFRVLSGIEDNPEEILEDYKEILLSNYILDELLMRRAIAVTVAAGFIFIAIALLRLSIDGLERMVIIEDYNERGL